MKSLSLLSIILVALTAYGQQAVFSARPWSYQLYPRDLHDSGAVAIAGNVVVPGIDSVTVNVYRSGGLVNHSASRLVYSGSAAAFSLQAKIHAELSDYRIEIRVGSTLAASADSVVCGDAYYIDGQSNAVCFTTWNYTNHWVRSYGSSAWSVAGSDTLWGPGQCRTYNNPVPPDANGHLAIGVWGMQLGRRIVESHGIPVCIINSAAGGTKLSQHMYNTWIASSYGQGLFRITHAKLKNNIKAIIWFQGEADCNLTTGPTYRDSLYALMSSWKADYSPVSRTYVFQLRPHGCNERYSDIVAEQQRILPIGHPDIALMSTAGVPGHDGCHYDTAGYKEIGDRIYRLAARDFYGSTDTVNIDPPNIMRAAFADVNHARLVLQCSGSVSLPAQTVKQCFSLDGTAGLVDSVRAGGDSRSISLYVHGATNARTVSYLSDETTYDNRYDGPWIGNPRGVTMLMFRNFPISADTQATAAPSKTLRAHGAGAATRRYLLTTTGIVRYPAIRECPASFYDVKGRWMRTVRMGRQAVVVQAR